MPKIPHWNPGLAVKQRKKRQNSTIPQTLTTRHVELNKLTHFLSHHQNSAHAAPCWPSSCWPSTPAEREGRSSQSPGWTPSPTVFCDWPGWVCAAVAPGSQQGRGLTQTWKVEEDITLHCMRDSSRNIFHHCYSSRDTYFSRYLSILGDGAKLQTHANSRSQPLSAFSTFTFLQTWLTIWDRISSRNPGDISPLWTM